MSLALAIACYLVQVGCNPTHKNRKNKTCADIVASDTSVWDSLMVYAQRRDEMTREAPILTLENTNLVSSEKQELCTTPVNHDSKSTLSERSECLVCSEHSPDIIFEPCGHRIACFECAQRMKKCLQCQEIIVSKTKAG